MGAVSLPLSDLSKSVILSLSCFFAGMGELRRYPNLRLAGFRVINAVKGCLL
jgi:hypothetical protein